MSTIIDIPLENIPKVVEKKAELGVQRGPGRPRKTPLKKPKPRNGVVSEPSKLDNLIEFVYDKPIVFKKLWNFYKAMAVEKLQIIFRPTEIIICGEDHHKKSKMRTKINTKNTNHYYCGKSFDIGIMCSDLEKIMMTIDRSYGTISFLSKHGYSQKNMKINFTTDIEIEKNHTVELIGDYTKIDYEEMFLDEDYPIKFELPGKYFKKMITDIKSFTEQITIKQDSPTDPLVFDYITKDKKIKSKDIVRNNKLVKLVSNLKGDDNFLTSFKIDYVKPISSTFLSDNILIYAHESKPLMFKINIDNSTVEIKIITEIIDERNKN